MAVGARLSVAWHSCTVLFTNMGESHLWAQKFIHSISHLFTFLWINESSSSCCYHISYGNSFVLVWLSLNCYVYINLVNKTNCAVFCIIFYSYTGFFLLFFYFYIIKVFFPADIYCIHCNAFICRLQPISTVPINLSPTCECPCHAFVKSKARQSCSGDNAVPEPWCVISFKKTQKKKNSLGFQQPIPLLFSPPVSPYHC